MYTELENDTSEEDCDNEDSSTALASDPWPERQVPVHDSKNLSAAPMRSPLESEHKRSSPGATQDLLERLSTSVPAEKVPLAPGSLEAISLQLSDIFEQVASQIRQQPASSEGSMPRETVSLETAPKPRVSVRKEVDDALAAARKGDLATVWKIAKDLNDRSKSDGFEDDFETKFADTLGLEKIRSGLLFYFKPGQDQLDPRNEFDVPAGMILTFADDQEGRRFPPNLIKIQVDEKGKVISAQEAAGCFGPEWSNIDKTEAVEKMIKRFRYNERQRKPAP